MRFGFIDGKQHSLFEVGEIFAITRERVRQIEVKALRYLRRPASQKRLLAFDSLVKTKGHESIFKDSDALSMDLSGESELTIENIQADNEKRFQRAVEANKNLASVTCKEDLLEENLFKNPLNRVSRDFAIGIDKLKELLKAEMSKIDDHDAISNELTVKKPDSK